MESMIFQVWQHESNLLTSRLMIFFVAGYIMVNKSKLCRFKQVIRRIIDSVLRGF